MTGISWQIHGSTNSGTRWNQIYATTVFMFHLACFGGDGPTTRASRIKEVTQTHHLRLWLPTPGDTLSLKIQSAATQNPSWLTLKLAASFKLYNVSTSEDIYAAVPPPPNKKIHTPVGPKHRWQRDFRNNPVYQTVRGGDCVPATCHGWNYMCLLSLSIQRSDGTQAHPKCSEQTNSLINTPCAPQPGGFGRSARSGDSGSRVRQAPAERRSFPPPWILRTRGSVVARPQSQLSKKRESECQWGCLFVMLTE